MFRWLHMSALSISLLTASFPLRSVVLITSVLNRRTEPLLLPKSYRNVKAVVKTLKYEIKFSKHLRIKKAL